jgi:hypothetical protein
VQKGKGHGRRWWWASKLSARRAVDLWDAAQKLKRSARPRRLCFRFVDADAYDVEIFDHH